MRISPGIGGKSVFWGGEVCIGSPGRIAIRPYKVVAKLGHLAPERRGTGDHRSPEAGVLPGQAVAARSQGFVGATCGRPKSPVCSHRAAGRGWFRWASLRSAQAMRCNRADHFFGGRKGKCRGDRPRSPVRSLHCHRQHGRPQVAPTKTPFFARSAGVVGF